MSWQDRALCAQEDADSWFPGPSEDPAAAKAICRRCPVRAECLQSAFTNREEFGVWGGFSERQRRRYAPRFHAGWSAERIIIAAEERRISAEKERPAA